jgi:DNA primase
VQLLTRTIPEDTIRRVKNTADIVDIVSDNVVLKKSGRNYLGLCPFHVEKTPSFTVSPEKQIFYCFGCHTGGNVFSYIMQSEGISFPEAVRVVAGKYGIEVPDEHLSAEQKRKLTEKEKLLRINQLAVTFFKESLFDGQIGQRALAYLFGRGMTRKIIDSHQLGYAPDRWDSLLRFMDKKRVPSELLIKSGLVVPRKDRSGSYDRFRDRVMFPIFDLHQQVIGFGGRVMGDDLPKYLNSPESAIYNKSRSLYGIDKARQEARNSCTVYLVEGYFDALALHLYGISNVVATLGTALTDDHVQLLKGMVGPSGMVILVYDSDQAGIKAARRSIGIFERGYLDARILILPQGYDPDDYLREHGPDDFLRAAAQAAGMMTFLMDSAIQQHGLTLEGKIKVVAEIQEPLAAVQDSVARALNIKQLAERLGIDETAIMEKVRQVAGKASLQVHDNLATNQAIQAGMDDGRRLEEQIVAMMLRFPTMIPDVVGRNLLDFFSNDQLRTIGQMIITQADSQGNPVADLVSMIDDPHYRNLMAKLAIDEHHWDRQGCERLFAQFESRYRRRKINDLQRRIEAAEKDNDIDLLCELLKMKQAQAAKGLPTS